MAKSAIVGYHQDERGDWIAELACGHQRHVRHQPPFHQQPWILEAEGRRERLGTRLRCRLCEQGAPTPAGQGGEAACFTHLVCPDCGAVMDGGPHRPGCSSG